MKNDEAFIDSLYTNLDEETRRRIDTVMDNAASIKAKGGKIAVVTGSGPNIHEGVTTLLAELMRLKIVDGVLTSSAVVAHEMAGALDRVKRVPGAPLGLSAEILPKGGLFEVTVMDDEELEKLGEEMILDRELMKRVMESEGHVITKAAGNMAYPMGLRTERLAMEVENYAKLSGLPFESVAGLGADPRTMIGAGAAYGVPVLVTVPQLVGGGMVGLCIGDSISLKRRSEAVSRILGGADMIIESGIALSQEIHDGPLETYTGHGCWSHWEGGSTYSLKGKSLVRIDLDPNLDAVWRMEREGASVQSSIDKGLPKTKIFKMPFRMEMSGFARLEGSLPLIGDLGKIWPVLALGLCRKLGLVPGFLSCPQESPQGQEMRDWIVHNVKSIDRGKMIDRLRELPR
ncbi:MAG: hypothetical protein NT080_08110 [Spirochaetes bacterium]|nr:hypothetical protein [Spirochaetota bacterium]